MEEADHWLNSELGLCQLEPIYTSKRNLGYGQAVDNRLS